MDSKAERSAADRSQGGRRNDRKDVVDFTEEHASVEFDAPRPGREAVDPPRIDKSFVVEVVGHSNVLVVLTVEEGVEIKEDLVKQSHRIGAVFHGLFKVFLSFLQRVRSPLEKALVVPFEG